jgi:hypothetical protein
MEAEGSVVPSPQLMLALKFSAAPPGGRVKPTSLKAAGGKVMKASWAVVWFGREAWERAGPTWVTVVWNCSQSWPP